MPLLTPLQLLTLKPGDSVDQAKGILSRVFPRTTSDPTEQKGVLEAGGVAVGVIFIGHPDMLDLKTKTVFLVSKRLENGNRVGLSIRENGKNKILVCDAQATVAPNELIEPKAPQEASEPQGDDGDLGPQPSKEPAQRTPTAKPDAKYVPMGPTIGMAINNACANLTARGIELEPAAVYNLASNLLRVSQRLEGGKLAAPYSERKPSAKPVVNDPCPACGQERFSGTCTNEQCEKAAF